jgi:hypothetical protein
VGNARLHDAVKGGLQAAQCLPIGLGEPDRFLPDCGRGQWMEVARRATAT